MSDKIIHNLKSVILGNENSCKATKTLSSCFKIQHTADIVERSIALK